MILVDVGLILSNFYVRLGWSWFILDWSSSTSESDLNETDVYIYVYVTDPPLSLYLTEMVLNYVWLVLLCLCIRLGCSWSMCGWFSSASVYDWAGPKCWLFVWLFDWSFFASVSYAPVSDWDAPDPCVADPFLPLYPTGLIYDWLILLCLCILYIRLGWSWSICE
jgi:hypothetical protein